MELSFLGRFHPLLIHLPIGILWMAFLFELLSRFKGYRKLKAAIRPSLFTGACSAVVSAVSGYWLSQEGGYDERLLRIHQYMGIGTAVFSVVVYLHRKYSFIPDKSKRSSVRLALFFILMIFLTVTGHFGGSLTRGEDYLFASSDVPVAAAISLHPISDTQHANVFNDIIKPIFEQKCYGCHSVKKQKGQLRLDSQEAIEKGGKHGGVVMAGVPDESELFKRIVLPVEAEHHMPPRERSQLTSVEADIIRAWIEEGASFRQQVYELKNPGVMEEFISANNPSKNVEDVLPVDDETPDQEAVEGLRKSAVLLVPIAINSGYLHVSFAGKDSVSSEEAIRINLISRQIIELDLSGCKLSPKAIQTVSKLHELRRLFLQKSSVTDDDLKTIGTLKKLTTLNLTDTKISDVGLSYLDKLSNAKHIYLYQTATTTPGVELLGLRLPHAEIDTGNYQLPFLPSDTVVHKRSK